MILGPGFSFRGGSLRGVRRTGVVGSVVAYRVFTGSMYVYIYIYIPT